MSRVKLLVGALFIIAVVMSVKHIVDTFNERDALLTTVALKDGEIKSKNEAIKQLHEEAVRDATTRTAYLNQLEKLQNETDKLKGCVANKSCGFTIRVRTVTIKAPSDGTTSPSDSTGAVEGTAELAPDAKRAYFRHRDAIDKVKANFDLCLTTLKDWQHDKRCR